MTTQAPSATTIRQQIEQLKNEKQALPLPDLAALEANITFHGARCHSIDPATANHHQRAMQDAMQAKDTAEKNWNRVQQINTELASLASQLSLLEGEERARQVESANRKMEAAHQEFYMAALQVVRAYRKCMNIGRMNQTIPGAATKLPHGFDFPHMRSAYGSQAFTTSQEMAMGMLRVENDDV